MLVTTFLLGSLTISSDFIKETKRDGLSEVVQGILYCKFPKKILFQVHTPINQIVNINNDTLIVYYPEENKAFKIISDNPKERLQWGLINKPDFSKYGYSLIKTYYSNDTVYTYWAPKGKKFFLVTGELSDKIVVIELRDVKNNLLSKIHFFDFINYKKIRLPTKIKIITKGKGYTIEDIITYKNVRFGVPIPDSILNFSIPSDASIKEIKM